MKILIRDIIYGISYRIDKFFNRESLLMVLCYHSIAKDDFRFSVDPLEFEKQLIHLTNEGYNFITMDDLTSFLTNERKLNNNSVLLTFDDGYKDLMNIKDLLKSRGIKPALFIMPFDSEPNYRELGQTFDRLDISDVKNLLADGWKVGSHTSTHSDLTKLSYSELEYEIGHSKKALENSLGINIDCISYPKGHYNEKIEQMVIKAGYKFAFTMDDTIITNNTNILRIPRIGIDRTHSIESFKATYSPTSILFRKLIKSLGFTGL